MKALLKLAVAVAIVVSTYYAIVRIAEYKADALAGGGTSLWVAPRLTLGRSAIYVNALGFVSRIYLREDEWAVASAIDSAAAAREKATGTPDA